MRHIIDMSTCVSGHPCLVHSSEDVFFAWPCCKLLCGWPCSFWDVDTSKFPGDICLLFAGHSDKFVRYKTFLHALDLLLSDQVSQQPEHNTSQSAMTTYVSCWDVTELKSRSKDWCCMFGRLVLAILQQLLVYQENQLNSGSPLQTSVRYVLLYTILPLTCNYCCGHITLRSLQSKLIMACFSAVYGQQW